MSIESARRLVTLSEVGDEAGRLHIRRKLASAIKQDGLWNFVGVMAGHLPRICLCPYQLLLFTSFLKPCGHATFYICRTSLETGFGDQPMFPSNESIILPAPKEDEVSE